MNCHVVRNGYAALFDPSVSVQSPAKVTPAFAAASGAGELTARKLGELLRSTLSEVADRRVGVLLSGGLDSALLLALLNELGVRDVVAVCVRAEDNGADVDAARQLCHELGIELVITSPIFDDYLSLVPVAISVFEDPRPDILYAVGLIAAAQELQGRCEVLIGGEPADDVLGASRKYFSAPGPEREFLRRGCLVDTVSRSTHLLRSTAHMIGAAPLQPYADPDLVSSASFTAWEQLQKADAVSWDGAMAGTGFKVLQKDLARSMAIRTLTAIADRPKLGLPHSSTNMQRQLVELLQTRGQEAQWLLWQLGGKLFELTVCENNDPKTIDIRAVIDRLPDRS